MPQAERREDGVERVKEARAQSEQHAHRRHARVPAPYARHKRAAKQRQRERQNLLPCDPFAEHRRAHQHDHRRRGVEQNGAHRQRAQLLTLEVAQRKKDHAHHTRAEKDGQVLRFHMEYAPLAQRENERQQHKSAEIADDDDVRRAHARAHQKAVKQPDAAPTGRRTEDIQIGKVFFHGFFSLIFVPCAAR